MDTNDTTTRRPPEPDINLPTVTPTDEELETATEEEVEVAAESNGSPFSSTIDQLRRRRRQLGEARTIALEIPGYEGLLFARYQYVDGMWDELKKIVNRSERSKSFRKELYGHADVLIFACKEILVKDDKRTDKDEEGLSPIDESGEITRYDKKLAEILDYVDELPERITARSVLFGLFRNDLAITAQQSELMDWAASNQQDLDKELQGE